MLQRPKHAPSKRRFHLFVRLVELGIRLADLLVSLGHLAKRDACLLRLLPRVEAEVGRNARADQERDYEGGGQ